MYSVRIAPKNETGFDFITFRSFFFSVCDFFLITLTLSARRMFSLRTEFACHIIVIQFQFLFFARPTEFAFCLLLVMNIISVRSTIMYLGWRKLLGTMPLAVLAFTCAQVNDHSVWSPVKKCTKFMLEFGSPRTHRRLSARMYPINMQCVCCSEIDAENNCVPWILSYKGTNIWLNFSADSASDVVNKRR